MNQIDVKKGEKNMSTLVNQPSTSMKLAVKKSMSSKKYLDINVILTFDTRDEAGNTQEFFDLKMNNSLTPQIYKII